MSTETIREALELGLEYARENSSCVGPSDIGEVLEDMNSIRRGIEALDQLEQRSTALGRIVGQKPEQQWIPVSDPPNNNRMTMVDRGMRGLWWGSYYEGEWYVKFGNDYQKAYDINGWQELPTQMSPPTSADEETE